MAVEVKRCSKCEKVLHNSSFSVVGGKFRYLRSDCKACRAEFTMHKKRDADRALKDWVVAQGCCVCGANHPAVLEVHHLHSSYKRFGRSQSMLYNVEDVKDGLAVVLCANDHNLFHGHFGGKNASFPPQTKEDVISICNFERSKGGV